MNDRPFPLHTGVAVVTESMRATGVEDLADRAVDELSGGQRQRVWIAMALAQQTDLLLLDEPTTFLDVSHQVEVLDLLTDLNRRRGTTVVIVMHDLNLACRYADHLVAMKEGRVVAAGTPREVVTEETIEEVFGLSARIAEDARFRTPRPSSPSAATTAAEPGADPGDWTTSPVAKSPGSCEVRR